MQPSPSAAALAPASRTPPPPKAEAAAATPPRRSLRPTRLEGRYLVQLAAVRTEAEALALAAKAKREQRPCWRPASRAIDRAVFGNMGAFYRVRFGPFASAQETQAVCAKLQGSGIDCLPVRP